jgi:threonine dehydratase
MIQTLVSLDEIRQAAERVAAVARRTPVIPTMVPGLFLKCENLQPMGAFKQRGAYNMIAQLAPDVRSRGVITYSSGNHGQAVAMAAQILGAPAVIVMPETAPAVKVEGAREYGAEVVFAGRTSFDRKDRAEQLAAARLLL